MEDLNAHVWKLEKDFWLGGADVYRRSVAEDGLMVFPGMVLTKSQTIDAIVNGPRWRSVSFTDQRIVQLTRDVIVVNYRASGLRDRGSTYSALVSTVYVARDGEWKVALHQQSPGS
jgi:hypothetical protein